MDIIIVLGGFMPYLLSPIDIPKNVKAFVEKYDNMDSDKRKQFIVSESSFSTKNWLEVRDLCSYYNINEGYILKVMATKKAFDSAKLLSEFVLLAGFMGQQHRAKVYKKILEFNIISDDDIELLCNSYSVRLRTVGWYLRGRKQAEK